MSGSVFGIRTPYSPAGYGGYSNNRTGSYSNNTRNYGGSLFSGGGYGNLASARVTAYDTLNFTGGGYNSAGTARGTALQTLRGNGAGMYRSYDTTPRSNFDRLKVADTFTPPANREYTPVNGTPGEGKGEFLLSTLRERFGR